MCCGWCWPTHSAAAHSVQILGLPLAYAAARSMQALLAGLEPADLRTFAAAAATVLVMTLLGSVLPAWRALRIDPATAMRN